MAKGESSLRTCPKFCWNTPCNNMLVMKSGSHSWCCMLLFDMRTAEYQTVNARCGSCHLWPCCSPNLRWLSHVQRKITSPAQAPTRAFPALIYLSVHVQDAAHCCNAHGSAGTPPGRQGLPHALCHRDCSRSPIGTCLLRCLPTRSRRCRRCTAPPAHACQPLASWHVPLSCACAATVANNKPSSGAHEMQQCSHVDRRSSANIMPAQCLTCPSQ